MAVPTPPASLNDRSVGFRFICKRSPRRFFLLPPSILQVGFVVLSYSQMQDGDFALQEADAGGYLCFARIDD